MSDFEWDTDDADDKAFRAIVTRNVREALDQAGKGIQAGWGYSKIEGGQIVLRVIPENYDILWDENEDIATLLPIDGLILQACRDCAARGAPHQEQHGIYLEEQPMVESVLASIEDEIAQVRALYRPENFDPNKWRK